MNDEDLDRALRSLPREVAQEGFTDRVLRRATAEQPPGPSRWRSGRWALLGAAACLALAAGLPGALRGTSVPEQAARARADLDALRREHRRLAADLERLTALAGEPPPVIYVGSSREGELVLDLARLEKRGGEP